MSKSKLTQLTDDHYQSLLNLKALLDDGANPENLENLVEMICDQAEEINQKSYLN